MAVKQTTQQTCKKVKLRRDAVTVHSRAHLVSSPPPRTIAFTTGVPPVTNRPISPLMSTDESDSSPNTTVHDHEISENKVKINYQSLSVDWILDSPYKDVFPLLRQLDPFADTDLIIEMLLHYTMIINGLPDCPDEDVPLAIYFFIEDTFSIQSKLVKCKKIRQYDGRMDVVVVFDSIRMKYDVLKKDELLEGTEVRMVNNHRLWLWMFPNNPNK